MVSDSIGIGRYLPIRTRIYMYIYSHYFFNTSIVMRWHRVRPLDSTETATRAAWHHFVAETLLVKCRQSRTRKQLKAESASMSAVWRYYKVDDNNIAIANCEICKLGIARGGKEKATFNNKPDTAPQKQTPHTASLPRQPSRRRVSSRYRRVWRGEKKCPVTARRRRTSQPR